MKLLDYINIEKATRLLKGAESKRLGGLVHSSSGFVHSIREKGSKINYRINDVTENL